METRFGGKSNGLTKAAWIRCNLEKPMKNKPMKRRMNQVKASMGIGVATMVLGLGFVHAGDLQDSWKSWRGPDANGSTSLGQYPTSLNPEIAEWVYELPGTGGSTPVTSGDQIIVTSPSDGQDAVLSIGFDGEKDWITSLGDRKPNKHPRLGSSSNSSPVTDGTSIFVYFKSGNFAALDMKGNIIWKMNLDDKYGPEELYWDQGSSPVLTKDHVIIARVHAGDSWIAAFNKSDGELAWKTPRNYQVPAENDNGYTTPILYNDNGRESLLLYGGDHLTSYDSATGKLVWWSGGFNPRERGYWPAIASPVLVNNTVVLPVGRDDRRGQAQVYGVKIGGSKDVTKSHRAWDRTDIGVFVPALAESNGKVYLLRNKGGVACLDPKTGKTIWEDNLPEGRDAYYSSPLVANGVLYAARNDGSVFAASVKDGFKLLSSNKLGEAIVASPIPAKNRILIRSYQKLYSFK